MGLFKKGNTGIIAKFRRTDLVIFSHSREGKTPFYSRINKIYSLKRVKVSFIKIHVVEFENSTDPDEAAHNEQTHLDLHCLLCIH